MSLLVDVAKAADNLDLGYAYEVDLDEQILDYGQCFAGRLMNVAPDFVAVKFESKSSFDVAEFVAVAGVAAAVAAIVAVGAVVLNVVLLVDPSDVLAVAAAPG